ncbi:sigma-54-dependent transcriptional regulator [Thalassobacillus sp. CUG 92003]|uniref:sigma-54-dependent transcriptional regulator n=1 Tax=Thalassobacillus sp. CUG 92003 TaxID=2736641 RepID=UPI0015E79881|nr:sigma-54-dependent transcriptional regulator [Thalassobacillus sp. CUG 92003]
MIKALVVAPYSGLAEVAKGYRHYDDELQIDVKIGNLEDGLQVAKTGEAQGYDVIISRGGTASLIEGQVSIPVVDIKVSGYDMLRVFTLLKGVQGKAALVGFPNISRGASTICSILDMDVKTVTISSREEVTELLRELKSEGYTLVIGDVVTIRQAERIGLQGILITSGKEAVMESFEEAKRLYRLTQRMEAQSFLYAEVLERSPQPMLTLRADGQVVLMNHRFREQVEPDLVEDPDFLDFNEQVSEHDEGIWRTLQVGEETYLIYGYRLDSDKSLNHFVFQKHLFDGEEGVKIWTNISNIPISGESQVAEDMRRNLNHYAELDSPVWIEGEQGTGRMMLACNLHFEAFGPYKPLISFDLSVASFEQVMAFFDSEQHLLPEDGTIVLKNVQKLQAQEQLTIKPFIEKASKQYKVLLISDATVSTLVEQRLYDHDLYYKIPYLNVHMPPLRHRMNDIRDLVQAFITENHMNFGYEAIGIREDALTLLTQYDWPGNIDQLKQTVEKLMMVGTQSYIEREDVDSLLEETEEDEPEHSNATIKIEGSLKEMEQRIIQKVLEQEGHNQSKVAERLKMNRTTLWRRLNS